jgi:transposase
MGSLETEKQDCTFECVPRAGLRSCISKEQPKTGLNAGLDVGDQSTAVCVLNAAGKILFESVVSTTPTAIVSALKPYRRTLNAVALESGTRSAWLYEQLRRHRLPVVCLDARHAHAALSARVNKTDKTDAQGLALLLSRGLFTTAYVKSEEAREIRLLLSVRKVLQRKALDLQMALRMTQKTFGGSAEKRGRSLVIAGPRKQRDLHRRLGRILLRTSEALLAEVRALDAIVKRTAKSDAVCRRMMKVPGVGPITALSFRAAVDDPRRFKSSRTVGAYFGLTPRRFQSGSSDVQGGISRMGDRAVRAALYIAADSMLRATRSKCALRLWALRLAERKGRRVAVVGCARRLAVILHRMWVTGRDFDSASPSTTG